LLGFFPSSVYPSFKKEAPSVKRLLSEEGVYLFWSIIMTASVILPRVEIM
jgi:hypothetical protein